jgi:flagellar hook-length control protein FliK
LQQEKVAAKQSMVSTPLTSEAWPKQFGEKIVWLARNDQQTAQININPPQLGPIQITLHLNGDQASAIFASPHAEVRQAIEAAMPQLKEMLSSAGINLGDANVGANLAQQNPDNPFLAANKNQSGHENAILPANENAASTGVSQVLQRGRGLVDLFA